MNLLSGTLLVQVCVALAASPQNGCSLGHIHQLGVQMRSTYWVVRVWKVLAIKDLALKLKHLYH